MKKALYLILAAGLILSAFAGKYALTNDTPYSIVDVLIFAAGTMDWGDDWLGEEEVILTDSTRVFSVEDGHYDIRLVDDIGRVWVNFDVAIFGYVDSEGVVDEYDLIDDDLD